MKRSLCAHMPASQPSSSSLFLSPSPSLWPTLYLYLRCRPSPDTLALWLPANTCMFCGAAAAAAYVKWKFSIFYKKKVERKHGERAQNAVATSRAHSIAVEVRLEPNGRMAIKKLRIRNVVFHTLLWLLLSVVAVLLIRHINYCKTADWLFGNIL